MAATARLYIPADLTLGAEIPLPEDQAHYLRHVLRQDVGAPVLLFNGRDGEWLAEIARFGKRDGSLHVRERTRTQQSGPDIWLLFAPIRQGRLETIVEKATELGAARILPVLTRRCQVRQVNDTRLQANAREAAEQCERLDLPQIAPLAELSAVLASWPQGRPLYVCLERADARPLAGSAQPGPMALLVGPEGGFAPEEAAWLTELPFVVPVSLGPRILRAETAAIAGMALLAAVAGN